VKPVEFFRFVMGSEVWTYTSADHPITYNDELYAPVPIGRGGIEAKNELSKANLDIKVDIYNPLARVLLRSVNEQVLTLTMFVQTDLGTGTAWKGRLSSLKPSGTQLTLAFESVFTSLRRPGLRARYQKTCRHALYGRGCTLDMDSFAVSALATAADGAIITVPDAALQADGWWVGGMLRAPDGVLRWIIAHAGSLITLSRPLESLQTALDNSGYGEGYGTYYGGVSVDLFPGCDHNRETCRVKFNNLDNYGGFPWIPSKNPMGGSSIV
jgi:uncharacterized phage protein (TIGR02218 family)